MTFSPSICHIGVRLSLFPHLYFSGIINVIWRKVVFDNKFLFIPFPSKIHFSFYICCLSYTQQSLYKTTSVLTQLTSSSLRKLPITFRRIAIRYIFFVSEDFFMFLTSLEISFSKASFAVPIQFQMTRNISKWIPDQTIEIPGEINSLQVEKYFY